MALEIIGFTGVVSGGIQDAIAQVDVPQDGVLRALEWDAHVNLDVSGELATFELSFIATNQNVQNDTRGRISSISAIATVLTSVGIHVNSFGRFVGPFELMVAGGERLFLHSVTTAGVTGIVRCNLHFDGGATVTRRSARR